MATRVGVLLLDSIDRPHRDVAGDYDTLFADVLAADDIDLVFYDGRADELPDHGECAGWVIPGSRQSVYDSARWISALGVWTGEALDVGVPLAGVCFGHQLIAQVLDTPVGKSDRGWNIGTIDYEVRDQPGWIGDMPERFRLIASHQDQVHELPPGATLLASSERCPIAAYSIGDNVLCVQGHPEFVPSLAASLYRSRVERIGQEPVAAALATLDRPLDRHLVAGWLLETIRRPSPASAVAGLSS